MQSLLATLQHNINLIPAAAAIVCLPIKPSSKQSLPPIEIPELDHEAVDEMWRELEASSIVQDGPSSISSPEAVTPTAWTQPMPTKTTATNDEEYEWVLPLRSATARHDGMEDVAPQHEEQVSNLAPIWKHLRPSKQDALRSAAAGIKEANGRNDLKHKSNEIDPYGHVARLLSAGHGRSQLDVLEVVSLPSSPDLEERDGFMLV